MEIKYAKKFYKSYGKLPAFLQLKTISIIEKFINNPFDPSLKNHKLRGDIADKSAISVTRNFRIVFEKIDTYNEVIILDVGTHDQVY